MGCGDNFIDVAGTECNKVDVFVEKHFFDIENTGGVKGNKGDKGDKGDTGAGLNILGTLDDPSELPAIGNAGDGWIIGGELYVWTNAGQWENVGQFQGPQGEPGQDGLGVPAGGTTGQILEKKSSAGNDTQWVDKPTSGTWGQISGDIDDQEDLKDILDFKLNGIVLTTPAPIPAETPANSLIVRI